MTDSSERFPLEISPQQVHRLVQAHARVVLVDCREPAEHALVHLTGAELLPMSHWPSWADRADAWQDRHVIVYCHHGMRSAQVATWLREAGVAQTQSMAGGIDQWAIEIDPDLPRY